MFLRRHARLELGVVEGQGVRLTGKAHHKDKFATHVFQTPGMRLENSTASSSEPCAL